MIAALALAAALLAPSFQDERAKRILDRLEQELQASQDRLRQDIRRIVREELEKAPAAKPAPKPPAPAPAPVPAPAPAKKTYLGIVAGDLTDADRKALGIAGGIRIDEVRGPAQQAGLKGGDILLEIDGQPVSDERMGQVMGRYKPGDVVTAVVLRNRQRESFKVTLGERKD